VSKKNKSQSEFKQEWNKNNSTLINRSPNTVLIVVLIAASLIRFWMWPVMQYHHDELSALMRTRFLTFSDLISHGVWIDGHPAFTQVFLWTWTALIGYSPPLVKLPFILSGVVSVYLIFILARTLFSAKSAYVSAALMAVLQYSVVYSQWARPYAFGLMFMLWAFYYLIEYSQNDRKVSLLGFAVFAALSAYTHYFALLQIIVLSALWFVFKLKNKQKRWFLLSSIFAFILWLPHLNITLHHLSLGGIGDWLQEPKPNYWMNLLGYSFHYSWFLVIPIVIAFVIYFFRGRFNRSALLMQGLLFGSWIIPYLIAYYYSIQVSALMHFGTMLFTFPSLVLISGSFFSQFDAAMSKIVTLFVLIFGIFSLTERSHFHLNIKTEFQDPIHVLNEFSREIKVSPLFDLRPDAVRFIDEKELESMQEVQLIEPLIENNGLAQYVNNLSSNAVFLVTHAGTPKEVLAQVLNRFPRVDRVYPYQSATAYLLFKPLNDDLAKEKQRVNLDGKEYGEPSVYTPIDSLNNSNIVIQSHWIGERYNSGMLVVEWKSSTDESLWKSSALSPFTTVDSVYTSGMAFDLRDLPDFDKGGTITAYVWNKGLDSIGFEAVEFEQVPSNKLRYGLFRRIKK